MPISDGPISDAPIGGDAPLASIAGLPDDMPRVRALPMEPVASARWEPVRAVAWHAVRGAR